jgi:hypothetical protein
MSENRHDCADNRDQGAEVLERVERQAVAGNDQNPSCGDEDRAQHRDGWRPPPEARAAQEAQPNGHRQREQDVRVLGLWRARCAISIHVPSDAKTASIANAAAINRYRNRPACAMSAALPIGVPGGHARAGHD